MRVAGRASDPAAEPPTGVKPKPFAASDSGGVAAALTTSERGRASEHGRKTGRENPRFRPPADPDTKPYSGSQTHGNPGRSVGSTASVGNTAHMKQLERAWNAQLSQSGDGGGGGGGGESVYKSGYSVDLMSTRELMELRRGIEATLDVRGVAPVSTYAPAAGCCCCCCCCCCTLSLRHRGLSTDASAPAQRDVRLAHRRWRGRDCDGAGCARATAVGRRRPRATRVDGCVPRRLYPWLKRHP